MKSLLKRKQGMQMMIQIAFVLVFLIVLVGVGIVVISNLGGSVACDGSARIGSWNATANQCSNATASTTPLGATWSAVSYGQTQLGQAGLLGWVPAVIALMIGMFFLAYFMGRNKTRY
jgi:hypothetical protein